MNQTKKEIIKEMENNEKQGHTFIIQTELIDRCSKKMKSTPKEILLSELAELVRSKKLAQEGERIYLPQTKEYEDMAAAALAEIFSKSPLPPVEVPEKLMVGDMLLADEQRKAVSFALNHRVSLILGGAGSGKSALIQAIVQNFPKSKGSFVLCSPTGKAANNLRERTNIWNAVTVHAVFWRTFEEKQKIFDKLVIVDEISMVSLEMLTWILTSIQPDCRLVLVGDSSQLPSVRCGNVVNDLLKLKVPSIRLKNCYRQSDKKSSLAWNLANFDRCRRTVDFSFDGSFCFISLRGDYSIRKKVCSLAEECYRKGENAQLLTPLVEKSVLSAYELNDVLQNALIPNEELRQYPLREGDRVQITSNDWAQNVMNGQVGTLHFLQTGKKEPQYKITCGKQYAVYDAGTVKSFASLAYAITVHKSQGSEYDTVIIPISRRFLPFVKRNLLYTAISRAKKKVILVGDPDVLDEILKAFPDKRNSALAEKTKALLYRGTAA